MQLQSTTTNVRPNYNGGTTYIYGPYLSEVPVVESVKPLRSGGKARWDRGFRPYTDLSVYGRVFSSQKGVIRRHTQSGSGVSLSIVDVLADYVATDASLTRGPNPYDIDDQDLVNRLMTKAYADARQQAFDIGTTAGELPEVVAMFVQLRRRLLTNVEETVEEYIRRAKRRHGADFFRYVTQKGVRGIMNEISSLWLEYQYGWKPLLSSARQLGTSLGRVSVGPPAVVVVGKASEEVTLNGCGWDVSMSCPHNPLWVPSLALIEEHTAIVRARVAIQVSPYVASFNVNPFVTALELIPLSFVYEWFLNVGDWLIAFDSYSPGTKMSACVSVKELHSLVAEPVAYEDETMSNEHPMSLGVLDTSYRRKVIDSWEPKLEFKLTLGVQRQASLAALIWQLLLKARV